MSEGKYQKIGDLTTFLLAFGHIIANARKRQFCKPAFADNVVVFSNPEFIFRKTVPQLKRHDSFLTIWPNISQSKCSEAFEMWLGSFVITSSQINLTSTKASMDPEGARLLTYCNIVPTVSPACRMCINIHYLAPPRSVL